MNAQSGQTQPAGRAIDDALQALAAGSRQPGPAFDELCVRAAELAAEGVVHAHPALLARASQLERWRADRQKPERQRRVIESSNITAIMRRMREFDPTPGMRIVMPQEGDDVMTFCGEILTFLAGGLDFHRARLPRFTARCSNQHQNSVPGVRMRLQSAS